MIQRIQTIFLFLAGVLLVVMLFTPIWSNTGMATTSLPGVVELTAFELKYASSPVNSGESISKVIIPNKNTIYIAALALLGIITSFYAIFAFKNRKFQMKLVLFNSLVISGVLGAILYAIQQGNDILKSSESGDFLIGFFLPIIALIFNVLANRYIKKDEALVRSVDRLR